MVIKLDAIFSDADEKWVKNIILYANGKDNYLYIDKTFTAAYRVTKKVLIEIFKKGLIIFCDGIFYFPICLTIADEYVSIDASDGTKDLTFTSVEKTDGEEGEDDDDDFVMDLINTDTGYYIEIEGEDKDHNMDDVVKNENELVEGKFNFKLL